MLPTAQSMVQAALGLYPHYVDAGATYLSAAEHEQAGGAAASSGEATPGAKAAARRAQTEAAPEQDDGLEEAVATMRQQIADLASAAAGAPGPNSASAILAALPRTLPMYVHTPGSNRVPYETLLLQVSRAKNSLACRPCSVQPRASRFGQARGDRQLLSSPRSRPMQLPRG